MEKCCDYCGTIFTTRYKHQRFCCSKHKDKARYGILSTQRHIAIDADAERALELYKTDYTKDEICVLLGRSKNFVYNTWRNAGLPRRKTQLQQKVEELRRQGLCCYDISHKLGKSAKHVRTVANTIGMPFTDEEKKLSIELSKRSGIETQYGNEEQRAEKQRFFIAHNFPDWEYVSGYVSSDDFVILRHKACGMITKKSAVTVRHKKQFICQVCKDAERKEREEAKQREQSRLKAERERAKIKRIRCSQNMFIFCAECGSPFITDNKRKMFCSEVCRKKRINKKHDKRIERAGTIDNSITLQKLIKRDNCTCWICGNKCDTQDFTEDNKGHFIVGRNYPSIDHVFPLSRGGDHVWDNVRLAHHYCNTVKKDKVVGYV